MISANSCRSAVVLMNLVPVGSIIRMLLLILSVCYFRLVFVLFCLNQSMIFLDGMPVGIMVTLSVGRCVLASLFCLLF